MNGHDPMSLESLREAGLRAILATSAGLVLELQADGTIGRVLNGDGSPHSLAGHTLAGRKLGSLLVQSQNGGQSGSRNGGLDQALARVLATNEASRLESLAGPELTDLIHNAMAGASPRQARAKTSGAWVGISLIPNTATSLLAVCHDLSGRKTEQARFDDLVDCLGCIVLRLDPQGRLESMNDFAERFFGYARQEIVGKNLVGTIVPAIPPFVDAPHDSTSAHGALQALPTSCESPCIRKDGSKAWVSWTSRPVIEDGHVTGVMCIGIDATESRRMNEEIRSKSFQDQLTGLPNRVLFLNRLDHALERLRRRPAYRFAVLLVDLDRFKVINDSLGHSMGDKLLLAIGDRLGASLRRVDTVARLGGDEFALLLEEIEDDRAAIRIVERIMADLAKPFRIDECEVFTSTSIGIVYGSPSYQDTDQIMRDADTAMYRAKDNGRNCYRVFHSDMHRQALELLGLETDLRKALEKSEFVLHYQPVYDIRTHRIAGLEALIRWNHPKRGMIPPANFIPLAEETGLIIPIGTWVLREACRHISEMSLPHGDPFTLCVNLSARQFTQPDLKDHILSILGEFSIPPFRVKLEITESALMADMDEAERIMGELKEAGLKLAVDDFGTGHSSLSYLHRFPFDTLKLDRSFVSRLGGQTDRNVKIVQSIMGMADNLEMQVVAEGIETQSQLGWLQNLRCPFGQGFFLARPLPFREVEELMERDGPRYEPHHNIEPSCV